MKTDKGTAEVFNNIFGNIVKNRNIFQYSGFDRIIENVKVLNLKDIYKYKKQPSILEIQTKCIRNGVFSLSDISLK